MEKEESVVNAVAVVDSVEAPLRRIQYHKIWQPDWNTDYVQIKLVSCSTPQGRTCPYCEAEKNQALPLMSILRHKFTQLWGSSSL